MPEYIACSNCFNDYALKYEAQKIGEECTQDCPQCTSSNGRKLTAHNLKELTFHFFVNGTVLKVDYGEAPVVQFNEHHYGKSTVSFKGGLAKDQKTIEELLQIGFFHYGPRLWMLGEIEPLKQLIRPKTRGKIIQDILSKYPSVTIENNSFFYRLRKNPNKEKNISEYDTPPKECGGNGRLNSPQLPVMYASSDLDICIHECRARGDDQLFVAILRPSSSLKLLNINVVLEEECSEFESLDLTVSFLFTAGEHSYPLIREIALEAHKKGFDGIIYPSYYTYLRSGMSPVPTAYGLSYRRFEGGKKLIESTTFPNLALFGYPIKEKKVQIESINKLNIRRATYDTCFAPIDYT